MGERLPGEMAGVMLVIDDLDHPGREKMRESIEAGLIVTTFGGRPSLRKYGDAIRGTLTLYCQLLSPEDPTFEDVEAALDWFEETYRSTHG